MYSLPLKHGGRRPGPLTLGLLAALEQEGGRQMRAEGDGRRLWAPRSAPPFPAYTHLSGAGQSGSSCGTGGREGFREGGLTGGKIVCLFVCFNTLKSQVRVSPVPSLGGWGIPFEVMKA